MISLCIRTCLYCFVLFVTGLPLSAEEFKPTAQRSIVPQGIENTAEFMAKRPVWTEGTFTEGPVVIPPDRLLFSDIGNRIMQLNLVTGKVTVFQENSHKANGMIIDTKGRLIVCEGANGGGRRVTATTPDGKTSVLADSWKGKKLNSPNDVAVNGKTGDIYFTDPRYGSQKDRELDFEGVFLITSEGKLKLVSKELQRPNGILVSIDGKTLYVADNHSNAEGNHHLVSFSIAEDGSLSNKKIMFDFGPNKRGIDGMTLDVKGNIYATAGRGKEAGIYVFSPEGKHLAFIQTPGSPTNCVFGPKFGSSMLYITAANPADNQTKGKFGLYRIMLKEKGWHVFRPQPKVDYRYKAVPDREERIKQIRSELRKVNPNVIDEEHRETMRRMVRTNLDLGMKYANACSTEEWNRIKNREDWESFRKTKLTALKKSLGTFSENAPAIKKHVSGVLKGEGYTIEKIVFASRPGLLVTANLYRPAKPTEKMPGILISHSHHTPKHHHELQDMGVTWARAGCLVLIPDHLGHGERAEHPFRSAKDFNGPFRVSRQDYYYRYDLGYQLHLAGESLMGWMVWDLMKGVDLLLAEKNIDEDRIILLGSVAGGGDPAAVTAALDQRIKAAVPFNFGGPQPETTFPLPEDARQSFNFAGSGSWESTRNLYRSAHDGFLPWVIVGGIAPRKLIYAHEFAWDQEHDPVWQRLQKIYGFYDAEDSLSSAHGSGSVKGRPPESTHCTHIGRVHRKQIHHDFEKWFGIEVTIPEKAPFHPKDDLQCLTSEISEKLQKRTLSEILLEMTAVNLNQRLKKQSPDQVLPKMVKDRHQKLRKPLLDMLYFPSHAQRKKSTPSKNAPKLPPADEKILEKAQFVHDSIGSLKIGKLRLDGILGRRHIPVLLLGTDEFWGVSMKDRTHPIFKEGRYFVIVLSQGGKVHFLKEREQEIAELLADGHTVIIPDLSGTGESQPDDNRTRASVATGRGSTTLMLGRPIGGKHLFDLSDLFRYSGLTSDQNRFVIWSDSLAETNDENSLFLQPRRIEGRPHLLEPGSMLLALNTKVLGDYPAYNIKGIYIHGGLSDFRSVLSSPSIHVPYDSLVPGMLKVADLPDLVGLLASCSICLSEMVDHRNVRLSAEEVRRKYQSAIETRKKIRYSKSLTIPEKPLTPAAWLRQIADELR